jgi:hypothetical protein
MSAVEISRSSWLLGGRSLLAAVVAGVVLLGPQIARSDPGVFGPFLGSWRGSGQVAVNDGHQERINCRATFSPSGSEKAMTISLICASDSFRMEVQSYVEATGQNLEGHWEERSRNVQGHLSGQVVGGQFDGTIVGSLFSAQMTLKATEKQQVVNIKPQGASFSNVDIVLARAR